MKNEATLEGVVVAGQPSDDELRSLAERGFTTVVNLRPAGELAEAEAPKIPAGVEYVEIPFTGDTLAAEHVERMGAVLDAATGPVLVHCAGGTRAAVAVAAAQAERAGDGAAGAFRRIAEGGFDVAGTPYGAFVTRYFTR
jgi:uncharacterized protein (TIGR01244 family)